MRLLFATILMFTFISRLWGSAGKPYPTAEIYNSLRQQVLSLSSSEVHTDKTDRLAIMMETAFEEGCYLLVATADGSASIYFSNGGGILGAGQNADCAATARELLELSRQFDDQLQEVTAYPLPKPGMTQFYIILKGRVLSGTFTEEDLGNSRLSLSPLFHKAHELITAIHQVSDSRGDR